MSASFICPRCGTQSFAREDVEQGFCWVCDHRTADEVPRLGLIPHLTVGEIRVVEATLAQTRTGLENALELAQAPGTRKALTEQLGILNSLQTAFAEARLGACNASLYPTCRSCYRPMWPRTVAPSEN